MVKLRKSNFELLRILSMLLIVSSHFANHCNFDFLTIGVVNGLWVRLLSLNGHIGVNLFVFISGYFQIKNIKFSVKKVLQIWLEVLFYSILLYLITSLFISSNSVISIKGLFKSLLPVALNTWWFVGPYLILTLFSPFINIMLLSFSKQQYKIFLVISLLLWSIFPTFFRISTQFSYFVWFIVLYSFSAYLSIFGIPTKLTKKKSFICAIVVYLLLFATTLILQTLGNKWKFFANKSSAFIETNQLPIFLVSIFIFIAFCNIDINTNKIINFFASLSFAVYLIHDYPSIRNILWQNITLFLENTNKILFIPFSLLFILFVFIICTSFDAFRKYFIERYIFKFIFVLKKRIVERIKGSKYEKYVSYLL